MKRICSNCGEEFENTRKVKKCQVCRNLSSYKEKNLGRASILHLHSGLEVLNNVFGQIMAFPDTPIPSKQEKKLYYPKFLRGR